MVCLKKMKKDPLIIAEREPLEETGYESSYWANLGINTGKYKQAHKQDNLFLARLVPKTSLQRLDLREHLVLLKIL